MEKIKNKISSGLVWVLICFCFFDCVEANGGFVLNPTSTQCTYEKSDFGVLGRMTTDLLNFFETYVSDLVLDAAVGTRILEEQLVLILETNYGYPSQLQNILEETLRKSRALTRNIIMGVRHNPNIDHREKMKTMPWVTTPALWRSPPAFHWKSLPQMNSSSQSPYFRKPEILNETVSDTCIGLLFSNCQIPEACFQLFLTRPLSQYSLTHQVIYLLIAKKKGCSSETLLSEKLQEFCSQVWTEANSIAGENYPPSLRDLFTEQIVVCSLAGYEEFLRRDWLQTILTWVGGQNSKCFLHFEEDENIVSKTKEVVAGSRKKRSDILVEGDNEEICSAHFTAIGLGLIGLHMRKFMEECYLA